MKTIFMVASIMIGVIWWFNQSPQWTTNGAEQYAQEAPEQDEDFEFDNFQFKGYTVTPLAEFEVNAKVLSRKNYWRGREAELSPVDLALGWGDMANPDVLQHINFSQSGRWLHYETERPPIPSREIQLQTANMHIIPADEFVEDDLDDIERGDIVRISGRLVRVDASDGWRWISSMTRKDTGDGACEVVYVDRVDVLNLY